MKNSIKMKIKNSLTIVVLATVLSLAGFASQAQAQFQKGDLLLNAGLGFGYYYAGGVSLNLNGEYSITDELGIGPYFAFTKYDYHYVGYKYDYTFMDFGVRASYHFSKLLKINVEQLDIYGGGFLGFVVGNYDYDGPGNDYDDPYDGGIRAGIHAGARYFFSPKFAAYGELGYGLSPLVLGASFKL